MHLRKERSAAFLSIAKARGIRRRDSDEDFYSKLKENIPKISADNLYDYMTDYVDYIQDISGGWEAEDLIDEDEWFDKWMQGKTYMIVHINDYHN